MNPIEGDHLLLLHVHGQIVGYARLLPTSLVYGCYLEDVYIIPELRGNGYGRYLMYKTEQHVKRFGITQMFLKTVTHRKFFEKLGYSVYNTQAVYGVYPDAPNYCAYVHHYFMEKLI